MEGKFGNNQTIENVERDSKSNLILELEGKLQQMESKCEGLKRNVSNLEQEKKQIKDDYDRVTLEKNKLNSKVLKLENELHSSYDHDVKENELAQHRTAELMKERNSATLKIKLLQEEIEEQKVLLHRTQSNSGEEMTLLRAENKTLTEERNNAHRNVTKQIGMLDEIMKNMERLTKLKVEAEEKYRDAVTTINELNQKVKDVEFKLAKAETPQPPSLSPYGMEMQKKLKRSSSKHAELCRLSWTVAHGSNVNQSILHRLEECIRLGLGETEYANLEKSKKEASSPYHFKASNVQRGNEDITQVEKIEINNLRKNLMNTIVSNRMFRVEELEFLFRSTLEFTKLDKSLVQTMIRQLRQELNLSV